MTSQHKTIVRRLIDEAWNQGKQSVCDELIASNAAIHDPTMPNAPRGPAALRQQLTLYRGAFSDLRMVIDQQTAEGDLVTTRWTAHGTHSGPLMGAAPTHRKLSITGIQIDRVANGQIQESWVNWDAMGLMQQIGLIPAMTAGAGATTARGAPTHR